MEATTMSAVAASVSASIGAIAAGIAAWSAWNSRKSAGASLLAIKETRRQREIDNARAELLAIGIIYDSAMDFIEVLAAEQRHNPAAVEQKRQILQRSIFVAGLSAPTLREVVDAHGPVSQATAAALRDELGDKSASLHGIIRGVAEVKNAT